MSECLSGRWGCIDATAVRAGNRDAHSRFLRFAAISYTDRSDDRKCRSFVIVSGEEQMRATTPRRARDVVTTLRARGDYDEASVVEALIEEAKAGRRLGVSGQTIKNWGQRGELTGFRVGSRTMVPADAIAAYWRLARTSLDLEEVSDEEVVQATRPVRDHAR